MDKIVVIGWHNKIEKMKIFHIEKEIPSIGDCLYVFESKFIVTDKINRYSANDLMRVDLELQKVE